MTRHEKSIFAGYIRRGFLLILVDGSDLCCMDFETYHDDIPRIVAGNTPASMTRGARLLHRLRQERARDLRLNKLLQATKEMLEKPSIANGRRADRRKRKGGRG